MKPDLSIKPARSRRISIPYFVLIVTLLLTALASYSVAKTAYSKDRLRFENAVQRATDNIQNRLETYIALLRAGSGLFAAREEVTLPEFRTFVKRLDLENRYPGIQGIGFSMKVRPEEKNAPIASLQRQGTNQVTLYPEYPRDEYHSVVYLEPLNFRNKVALGYDMFSESVRRAAMELARDSGLPAASGRVTLRQEIEEEKQAGFLIYLPIYSNGVTPETMAERQRALIGFIYSPFRADDLLKGIFGNEKYTLVDFEIYDGTQISPENLLHRSQGKSTPLVNGYHPRFTTTRTIQIAGRPWIIAFTSRPEFELISGRSFVPYISLSGIVISLILFGVTRSQAMARRFAERSAADLRESQAALRESESRLRRLVDANIIGIVISDSQGNILEANDAFLSIVGYSRSETLSTLNWWEITPDEYRHLDDRAIEEMKQTGSHAPFEKEYIRKDGTRVPVLQGRAYLGGADELAVGFVLDLTQQKQAEESVRNSETRFRTLIEQSPLSTQILSPDGRTIQVNKAWEDLWGITLEDLHSYNILEDRQLIVKEIMPEIKKAFAGEGMALPPILYDISRTLPGMAGEKDSQHWVQAYIYPVKDEAGQIREVVIVHEDITDRKQLEAQLEARAEELFQANRLKDEFLATLSHELRTPLNAMLGWSQLLRVRKFDGATTQRALETIERNTKALSQIIEDLLDVSRIMSGKFRLQMRPVTLQSAIEDAIEAIRCAAEVKEIQVISRFDPSVTPVSGDYTRLQQIIWNLLSNAIKFTPKGGRVEVQLDRDESNARITVTDTGQGIGAEFLPYIFERFRQEDGAITRSHGGLGLGLAIARHLVELHGGSISATSPGLGQGATFVVTLPLRAILDANEMSHPSIANRNSRYSAGHSDEGVKKGSLLDGLWVLVVDDEADVRHLLTMVLEDSGARVTAVGSAREALDLVADSRSTQRPDVLISDIGMPGEDGYALIRKIRTLAPSQGGRIPAAALSAYARAEERDRSLAAGYQLHVPKPIAPQDLIEVVVNLVARVTY